MARSEYRISKRIMMRWPSELDIFRPVACFSQCELENPSDEHHSTTERGSLAFGCEPLTHDSLAVDDPAAIFASTRALGNACW